MLLDGHVHGMHESLNLLYGITIEHLATNAFKDSDFSFRPVHTFRRKLASHLEGDILRLADVAVLNGSAADYFAYLAFFHDMLPGSTRSEGSPPLSPGDADLQRVVGLAVVQGREDQLAEGDPRPSGACAPSGANPKLLDRKETA